jgi:hypothetical protein
MRKRREFLAGAAAVAAVAGLMPHRLLAKTTNALDIDAVGFAAGLTKDKFTALLNETFYIHTADEGVVIVQLVQVKTIEQPANPEQFSLIFRGPALPALAASLYDVEHWLAGRTSLYLEPSRAEPDGNVYRADLALLR